MFRNGARYALILLVSVLVGLLLAEGYVRLTGEYWALYRFRERSLEYEPSLFARNVFPRQIQTARRDPDVHYRINRHGYRGDSFPLKKPPGTTRIMIYGGSAAFDILAGRREDWPTRAERWLRDHGHPEVRIINAGIPGNASFDSLGRFWTEGHRLNPDYVLIYHAWNDIKYFSSSKPLLRQFDPAQRVQYVRLGDPRITYQNSLDRFLGRWSQLYLRLRLRYYEWKLNLGPEGKRPETDHGRIAARALDQYRLTLANFVDSIRNTGATPVLMTQARLVAPNLPRDVRTRIHYETAGLSHPTLLDAFQRTDQVIRSVGRKEGVEVIDASGSMTGRPEFFFDHVHVTDTGSRALARITGRGLRRIITAREAHAKASS